MELLLTVLHCVHSCAIPHPLTSTAAQLGVKESVMTCLAISIQCRVTDG